MGLEELRHQVTDLMPRARIAKKLEDRPLQKERQKKGAFLSCLFCVADQAVREEFY